MRMNVETSGNPRQIDSNHLTYMFVPISFNTRENLSTYFHLDDETCPWKEGLDFTRFQYLLSYATRSLSPKANGNSHIYTYKLKKESFQEANLLDSNEFYHIQYKMNGKDLTYELSFQILDVEFFYFTTGIGIMAYKIVFDDTPDEYDDYLRLSYKNFILKKAKLRFTSEDPSFYDHEGSFVSKYNTEKESEIHYWHTFDSLTKKLLGLTLKDIKADTFFHNWGDRRMNVLSLYDTSSDFSDQAISRELFYLRNNYGPSYHYYEDPKTEEIEIFKTGAENCWGVTTEAAVCMIHSKENKAFFEDWFSYHFQLEYVFLYAYVLHQKYCLYKFLCISSEQKETRDQLEVYQRDFYTFESDFSVDYVSEVPQYQKLYERLFDRLAIRSLYADVNEPIDHLKDLNDQEIAKEEKTSDRRTSFFLTGLSILAIFSAFVDSWDFIAELFESFNKPPAFIHFIQMGVFVLILLFLLGMGIYIITQEIKGRKGKK